MVFPLLSLGLTIDVDLWFLPLSLFNVLTAFLGLCVLNYSSSTRSEVPLWVTVYDLSNVSLNLRISSLNHWVWINANKWDDNIQVTFASCLPSLLQEYQANTRLLHVHTQNCCSLWGTAECGRTIYVTKSPLFTEKALKTKAVAARAVLLSGEEQDHRKRKDVWRRLLLHPLILGVTSAAFPTPSTSVFAPQFLVVMLCKGLFPRA